MRAFIALELSEGVRSELSSIETELKKTDADVKWVKPENIHLTLKFLGWVEEGKIEKIKEILNDIASKINSFEINISKIGAFPNINYPRVIWVGIDKNSSEVEKLASLIEGEFKKIGFQKETRSFSAHLTLGRVKSGKNKALLKEKLTSIQVNSKSCIINSITLFESTLTPHGPIYKVLHEAKFLK